MNQDKGFISMLLWEDLKVPEVPFNGEICDSWARSASALMDQPLSVSMTMAGLLPKACKLLGTK